jgi:hypothetical protein
MWWSPSAGGGEEGDALAGKLTGMILALGEESVVPLLAKPEVQLMTTDDPTKLFNRGG